MDKHSDSNLRRVFITHMWLLQALLAAPLFFLLGISALYNLINTFGSIYALFTHFCTALLAGGILYLVLIEKELINAGKNMIVALEATKSFLATLLWTWLMYDAIWGPGVHSSNEYRDIVASGCVAGSLLFIVVYSTLMIAVLSPYEERDISDRGAEVEVEEACHEVAITVEMVGENTPLLRTEDDEN